MATIIKLKRSNTGSSVPTTSDLADGEVALNTADKKIYVRNGGSIVEVANFKDFGSVAENIVPDANGTRDLGTASKRWGELFLTGSTINLGGATISSDGSGTLAISANGATLPAGSKVGTQNIAESDADTGIATRSVPLFTAAGGLDTAAKTFTFAAQSGRGAQVFSSFKKADGSTAGKFELFTF